MVDLYHSEDNYMKLEQDDFVKTFEKQINSFIDS